MKIFLEALLGILVLLLALPRGRALVRQLVDIFWHDDYILREACLNRDEEMADYRFLLLTFHEVAEARGLTWWLDYGTLLGAWRYQDVLPYDHDADVGYLAEQRPLLEQCVEEFAQRGIELSMHYSALFYKGRKMLDVYPWTRREGRLLIRPEQREGINVALEAMFDDVPEEHVLPVWQMRFLGEWFPCPNNPERLLRHRYPTCRIHMRLVIPHRQRCWFCAGFWREAWRVWRDRSGPVLRHAG